MDPDLTDPDAGGSRRSTGRRRAARRGERGATLVEYALIVAVFAVGTVAAIDLLQVGAERTTSNTADNISSGPR